MKELNNDQLRMQKHWINSNEFNQVGYENSHMERRKWYVDFILETKPKSVLEIGCFGGYNLRLINEIDSSIKLTGFDINEKALNYAKSKLPTLTTVHGSIYELNKHFNENEFDVIFTSGCLIHIPNGENNIIINNIRDNIMNIAKKYVFHFEHNGKDTVFNHIRWTHDFINLYNSAKKIDIINPPKGMNKYGAEHVIKVQI
jgi:SAM-dependent methyltransferase